MILMSLVTIPEASKWASEFLEKDVLPANISYLVQYGKVKKHGENNEVDTPPLDMRDLMHLRILCVIRCIVLRLVYINL